MSEMVERVALAFCAAECRDVCETACGGCCDQARIAIAAMREPTIPMIATGEVDNRISGPIYDTRVKETWQAMIDEALK